MLVSGAEPTLSVPVLHPPVPQTVGASITATGIMCQSPALSIALTAIASITATGIMCRPPPPRRADSGCFHHSHGQWVLIHLLGTISLPVQPDIDPGC